MNLTNGSEQKETTASHRRAVERVIENISRNLDEPLTMGDMARMANISPFHFNRVFHQVTGLPPSQFLYAMRLEKAKRLLLTTQMSITDVCFEVGYNSLGTFTSRFTELVGLSPREFRNLSKKIRRFNWESFFQMGWREPETGFLETHIRGKIDAPENFEGLIFIGLFKDNIPQSEPAAGTLLTRGDLFRLTSKPLDDYNLLVAAIPRSENSIDYLLLNFSTLLVGFSKVSPHINYYEIVLRPLQLTDPPILTALPLFLVKKMSELCEV